MRRLLIAGLALPWLGLSSVAEASSSFVAQVPNGNSYTCMACHLTTNPPTNNAFGDSVMTAISGNAVRWTSLWMLDSDGDGQSNGEELGDPCGVWRLGQAPGRTNQISNPGLSTSMSPTPDVPSCTPDAGTSDAPVNDASPLDASPDAGRAGFRDAGASEEEVGGCGCNDTHSNASGGAALLIGLLMRAAVRVFRTASVWRSAQARAGALTARVFGRPTAQQVRKLESEQELVQGRARRQAAEAQGRRGGGP